ncbi:thioredoxin family protein [Haloarchaeobius sp. DYHT-AS-18]|uniref:thioredoxin family protein n=1 Tax=Haloarchaeobius sp. DYHT-AS-18 TaxID=3446117 RepID=UPI003EB7F2A9
MSESRPWPDGTVTLTPENFDAVVGSYPTTLVYMWADACVPCKEFKPELSDLADEWHEEVAIGTLDTAAHPELAKQHWSFTDRLQGKLSRTFDGPLPTFCLYEGDEMVAQTTGIDREYALDGRKKEYVREWVDEQQ